MHIARFVLVAVACALTFVAAAPAAKRTYLGYAEENQGCVFLGWYDGRTLVPVPRAKGFDWAKAARPFVQAFPVGEPLRAIHADGSRDDITVESAVPDPDYPDTVFAIASGGRPVGSQGAMFSTRAVPIQVLKSQKAAVSIEATNAMRQMASELWNKAVKEQLSDSPKSTFTLGLPEVNSVAALPDVVTVLFPVEIREENGALDHRGSMFFIYSNTAHRIVLGKFGHPEWSPGSRSVLTIKPLWFFRIGKDREVYFMAVSEGPWEDPFGRAIYVLRSGKERLACW